MRSPQLRPPSEQSAHITVLVAPVAAGQPSDTLPAVAGCEQWAGAAAGLAHRLRILGPL
jgi:hypothetical protein